MKIKTLILVFDIDIAQKELSQFRGAIISMVGGDDLFHNHTDNDGFCYRYPLIQYKRIGGKAVVMAIGEGVDVIGKLLNDSPSTLCIGEREVEYKILKVLPGNMLLQVWQTHFNYHLRKWLPLNSENYARYQATNSVAEHVLMLENILTANILSMCKGLGITIDKNIECSITHIEEPRKTYYKGIPMMSFDVEFSSNMSLPDYIGLGKGVSLGHGVCVKKNEKN